MVEAAAAAHSIQAQGVVVQVVVVQVPAGLHLAPKEHLELLTQVVVAAAPGNQKMDLHRVQAVRVL